MKNLTQYLIESKQLKLTYYDTDHQSKRHQEVIAFNEQPNKETLSNQIISVLTKEIKWFDKKWLAKNKDVQEEIDAMSDELLKNKESRFIYTYKFYLE